MRATHIHLASLCDHGVLIWEGDGKARVEFPQANDFIWTEAQQPWARQELENFLRGSLNRAMDVRMVASAESELESPYQRRQAQRDERRQLRREALLTHPLLEKARTILKAEFVDVELEGDEQ